MVAHLHIVRQVQATKSHEHDNECENDSPTVGWLGSATRLATKFACDCVQLSDQESAPPKAMLLFQRNNVVGVPKNVANFGAFGFTSIDWTKVGFTKGK